MDANGLDPQFEEPTIPQDPTPPDDGGTPPVEPPQNNDDEGISDSDLVRSILAQNGITDPDKIKFEGEDGKLVEQSWKNLSKEEKLSILTSASPQPANEFTEEEVNLINQIRESRQTPTAYLSSLERAAAEATKSEVYNIDGIDDDELFVLDALDRYGNENVTDEQLEALLNNAKSDPELYAMQIQNLRQQYKQKEDDLRLQQQQQTDAQQEQEYQHFSEAILGEIKSLTQVAGQSIELSIDDMNELANYILTRDENGNSEFGKAMNDPKLFTQVAFWALKGNDIMNEISSQIKLAYERGLAAGQKGQSKLAFSQKKDNPMTQNPTHLGAFDLDVQ